MFRVLAPYFKLIKRNCGKIRIFIHCTLSNMFANESTLVLWLSDSLSMDSHSVSDGVFRLSNIIFTATGTNDVIISNSCCIFISNDGIHTNFTILACSHDFHNQVLLHGFGAPLQFMRHTCFFGVFPFRVDWSQVLQNLLRTLYPMNVPFWAPIIEQSPAKKKNTNKKLDRPQRYWFKLM